ncbi:MAG: MBL fold metallo-hydrolase [Granulosicoccus sp.]|nr:MBL fold metallo-hydrolase [Granulosicoccus sp.]
MNSELLQYEIDQTPEPGDCLEICRGIRWVRMPLPFALDHVNCWLIGNPGDQLLIDTGVNNELTNQLWQKFLVSDGRHTKIMSASGPEKLLVTHFHPDHMGLAGTFHTAGCDLIGSNTEVDLALRIYELDDNSYAQQYAQWYRVNGLPDTVVQPVLDNGNTYRQKASRPPSSSQWTYLQHDQNVTICGDRYRVIIGAGHAPAMIMLYRDADQVLISADQVLPRISPNVSVMPVLEDQNPLASFLQSLESLRDLPADTLVLPSHGRPFRGLHNRLTALLEHHRHRLEQVLDACVEPRTAYQLFPVLFSRELDAQQMSFALGESLSHLHYLENCGELERQYERGLTHFVKT